MWNQAVNQPHYGSYPNTFGYAGDNFDFRTYNKTTVPMGVVKGTFIGGDRKRLNGLAILLSIVVPCVMFSSLLAVTTFIIHYRRPTITYSIAVVYLLLILAVGALAAREMLRKMRGDPSRQPTWYVFMLTTMVIAYLAAVSIGEGIYEGYMQHYYNIKNMNVFSHVDPTRMHGGQLQDAGIINFLDGAFVDSTRSMGFKNVDTYCVAPITYGDKPNSDIAYDFWAVGKGCCSGKQADFHCKYFNTPHANGGVRVLADEDRSHYRLAVQQAEATYKIEATHPLFFEWVPDADQKVSDIWHDGFMEFIAAVCFHGVFQVCLVVTASILFARLGNL